MRSHSYGENKKLSVLDQIGGFLSRRSINKIASKAKFHNNLLDAGCGYEAKLTKTVHSKFRNVYLVDLTVSDKFTSNDETNYIRLEGNLELLLEKIPNDTVDLLIANNIVEHLENPKPVLINFKRILTREGILYINVPSWKGKFFLEAAAFKLGLAPKEEMEDHKFYFNKHELWLLLRSAGFQPSSIKISNKKLGLNTSALIRASKLS